MMATKVIRYHLPLVIYFIGFTLMIFQTSALFTLRKWMLLLSLTTLIYSANIVADVKLDIEGIDGDLLTQVENYLGTPVIENKADLKRIITKLEQQAPKALQALGYYSPVIKIQGKRKKDDWLIAINIAAGEPVKVASLDISLKGGAQTDAAFADLIAEAPLQLGSIFNHGQYESIKASLYNLAIAHGYFQAQFEQSLVQVYPEQNIAEILLIFNSGPRANFGEITFSKTPLDKDFLTYWINFQPGEPYDAKLINELHRTLFNSHYFSNVRIRPQRKNPNQLTIPVDVQLTAAKTHQFGVGAGFATDSGPRVKATWKRPYLNSSGHSFNAGTSVSAVQKDVSAQYKIPLLTDPQHDFLTLNAGIQKEDVEDIDSILYTASVQKQKLTRHQWTQNLFLRWQRETFFNGDEEDTTTLYLPGFSYSLIRSSGGVSPNSGHKYSFEFQFAEEALASDISLQYLIAGTKRIHSLASKHRAIWRLDAGILNTNDFDRTPSSLRFFAGGDSNVRGFGFKSISPEDADGEKIGGHYLTTGSLEYDYQFADEWRAAIFTDAGDAYDESGIDLKHSVGFGVRWISPIGPLQIDLAVAISEEDNPIRLHLSIGPEL